MSSDHSYAKNSCTRSNGLNQKSSNLVVKKVKLDKKCKNDATSSLKESTCDNDRFNTLF